MFLGKQIHLLGLQMSSSYLEREKDHIFFTNVLIKLELEQTWECVSIVPQCPSRQQELSKLFKLQVKHPINLPIKSTCSE